mgnify:FL=1|jgi:chromosome segregation ATPase
MSQNTIQSMILKNQKLEGKLKDMDLLKRELQDIKSQRDKQQHEFKLLHEDKQKLYEDIMALKDQISTARAETKEKIIAI